MKFAPIRLEEPQSKVTAHSRIQNRGLLPFVSAGLLLLLMGALSGCAVRLVGDYDDTFDKWITEIEQKAELHFAKLESTPNTPFDQDFYDDIVSRLAVLKTRAAVLPQYELQTQQLAQLQTQFQDFEKFDKSSPRPVAVSNIAGAQSGIAISFESILKLELAMKRTGSPSVKALAPTKK